MSSPPPELPPSPRPSPLHEVPPPPKPLPPPKPSSPSPKRRVRLHLNRKGSAPDEVIFRANSLLSSGDSRKAIELYTQILYDKAPGHIIAFLNRSMAYVHERRPELAAVDAYRAFMSINILKTSNRLKGRPRSLETLRYLRLESLMVELGRDWTQGDKRYIPCPAAFWPKRPLASLIMDMDDENCPVWHEVGIENVCPRLEVRAIFRLCGALFDCRGGAAQEALGLIDDIGYSSKLYEPENRCFKFLGDGIVSMVTQTIDIYRQIGKETDDEYVVLMPIDGVATPRITPGTALKTRVTVGPALQYWTDTYEPDFAKPDTHRELSELVAASSNSCIPVAVDQSSVGLSPRIELRASRDHLPGDPIVYERGSWNVTTCSPEKVLDAWHKNKAGCLRLYCDTCATALLMSEDLVAYAMADAHSEDGSSERTMREWKSTVKDMEISDEQRERRVKWSLQTHITLCSPDHEAWYCCTTCRRNRRVFDPGVHESKIESELRNVKAHTSSLPLDNDNVSAGHPRGLYNHSKTQTLYDLLFLRIYASALNQQRHPLELVKFLRGGLSPASTYSPDQPSGKKPGQVPFSFQNNIVRPIWIINQYHRSLKQDPFRYLEQSDGWVINTLLAKIQHSVEIATGAMSAIIFDIDKEEKTYCYRGLEAWVSDKNEAVYDSEEELNEVWIARLDPLVSMIRVADEAKSEKPNCWVKYEEGIRIIAGQPDDPLDEKTVAVKQGEVMLRTKPKFLGGSPYHVVPYSQRDVAPSPTKKGSESPVKKDRSGDHVMADTIVDSIESDAADEPIDPASDNAEASSESVSSSDEEMLDILDSDSPEAPNAKEQSRPSSSPPSSPVGTADYIANLDGQAEALGGRLNALSGQPAGVVDEDENEEEEDDWEEVEILKRRLGHKRRRLSGYPAPEPFLARYRTFDIRVNKPRVNWEPRSSLHMRANRRDFRRSPSPVPPARWTSMPSTAAADDAFGDAPVGQILTSGYAGEVSHEPPVDAPIPRVLEMRSIADVRRGTLKPEHDDPGEGSSGDVKGKGKAVLRGGDALYTVCDGAADEDDSKWETDYGRRRTWMTVTE